MSKNIQQAIWAISKTTHSSLINFIQLEEDELIYSLVSISFSFYGTSKNLINTMKSKYLQPSTDFKAWEY